MRSKYIISFFIILFIFTCKDKTPTKLESSPEIQEKLNKSKEILLMRKLEKHTISGFPTMEEAITIFLKEIINLKSKSDQFKSILSDQEKHNVFFPNIYGYNTSLDVTPLEDYKQTFDRMEDLGIKRLRELKLENTHLKSLRVILKSSQPYGNILVHKIGRIELTKNGSTIEITQIKSVLEQNGVFKVAVVAP